MRDFLTALALVLVIEGTIYALLPGMMKAALARLPEIPDTVLRTMGVIAVAVGVFAIYLIRG